MQRGFAFDGNVDDVVVPAQCRCDGGRDPNVVFDDENAQRFDPPGRAVQTLEFRGTAPLWLHAGPRRSGDRERRVDRGLRMKTA